MSQDINMSNPSGNIRDRGKKVIKDGEPVDDDARLYENTNGATASAVSTVNTSKKETTQGASNKNETLVTDKAFVVVGNVDAGKSTLIGTLTTGLLDNGRGSARQTVARHKHELEVGRTSDISTRVLKFPNGKIVTLVDLCGHQKYLTTTATGIAGMRPDYAIVVASPARGVCEMTVQHFKMLMSFNIPVLIVCTHIDMAQEESCKIMDQDIVKLCKTYKRTTEFMNDYYKYHKYTRGAALAKKLGIEGSITTQTLTSEETEDVMEYLNSDAMRMTAIEQIEQGLKMAGGRQSYIPVVYVSNVDGYYLDVVKRAMMTVEPRDLWSHDENANSIVKFFRNKLDLPNLGLETTHVGSTFYIDHAYTVKGVGLVISGINRGDPISANDELYLGPMSKAFVKVKIRSIHNDNRDPVESLGHHHRGCLAIKGLKEDIKKNQIVRGMVLISRQEMISNVCYRYNAAVTIFGGLSATLRTGYSPVIHAGMIRQTAKLILPDAEDDQLDVSSLSKREKREMTQKKIKSGSVEKVVFKFRQHPEYLEKGTVFVFRSGDIHGVGCVIDVVPLSVDGDAQPEPLKKKYRRERPVNLLAERKGVDNHGPVEKVIVKVGGDAGSKVQVR